ncbi:hypothetical protein AURDEDRAFT_111530 [Auricularia subglabra TFB-10046 SS5]|nr:hypothetical protein AURDEDRAFT_111530 [Auricularia subglabra TFB-10046 SS5]
MGVLHRRQASSDTQPNFGKGFSPSIWVPIVVVVLVLVLISIGTWARRRMQRELQTTPAAPAANANGTGTADGQTAARQRRRNRRRASQISTKSLPAYMEEAGDEEVVLVSRRLAAPMPTVTEGIRPSMDSEETMPEENVQTPLLERDPREMPFSNAVPPERGTGHSPHSAASPDSPDFNASSRSVNLGDAPPYFEAVSDDRTGQLTHRTLPSASSATAAAATTGAPLQRSQSLFRTLFSRDQTSPTNQNADGQPAVQGHRSSTSLSSLRPSLSLYRSRTNESEDPHRQSQIALRNISAPLAHTVVRTEFTFPKTGPTESQIKFLASRESLGRFGLPFGDEARAEPPSFDTLAPSSSSPSLHTTGHGRRPSGASSIALTSDEHAASPPAASEPLPAPSSSPQPSEEPAPPPSRLPDVAHHPRLPEIITSRPTPPATPAPPPTNPHDSTN